MDEDDKMTVNAPPPPERSVPAEESPQFQAKILQVLNTILEHYTLRYEEVKRETAIKMLTRIQPWIAELRTGPHAIPSPQLHSSFFKDMDQKCHQIMATINLHRAREKMMEDMAKMRMEENYRTHRPSYTRELMGQPWQQFLHPGAPGWPEVIPGHERKVCHQIVPNGGMRLLLKWEEEVKEIYAFLDAGRAGPSRFKSGLRTLSVEPILGVTKNGDVRTVSLRRMQNTPFTPLHRDLTEMDNGDFALANRVLGKLEGNRIQDSPFLVADVMEFKRGPLGSRSGSESGNGNGNGEADQRSSDGGQAQQNNNGN